MAKDVSEQLKKIKETLDKYKDSAHILTPITRKMDLSELSLPPYKRVAVRTIWISADKNDGEVYTLYEKPDDLILTKIGLQKLGSAAGIVWSDPEVFINENEPLVAAAKIVGTITDLDGSTRSTPGRASLDLRDDSAQAKKKKPGQLAVARANIVSLVETGAKNKCRRELLGLQASYKAEDLNRPFVLFTLIADQEAVLRDFPILRQTLAAQQIGLGEMLFQRNPTLIEASIVESQNLLPAFTGEDTKSKVLTASVDEIVRPEPTAQASLGELHDRARKESIASIEDLYKRKVRGGRSAKKPPLSELTDSQLADLESNLIVREDLK
jgi:hypothetical protein